MEFFKTPQKIKKLRKELGMKQYELADEDLTSAFISMIELGKRGLSKNTAEKLAAKLNQKAESLGIELNIDGRYLLCSPEEEAEAYCEKELKKATTIEQAEELILICKRYRVDKAESKVRRFIGDILFSQKDYEEASVQYSYAIDLCKNTDDMKEQPYLYNRNGHCKLNLLRYREAMFLFERAIHYSRVYSNEEIEQRALFNLALCHQSLGDFDTALRALAEYFEISDKDALPDPYIRARILQGNCYKDSGKKREAIEVYNSILQQFSDLSPYFRGLIYTNMGGAYLEERAYEKSLEAFTKAQRIRSENDKFGLPFTLVEKSQIYICQGLYEDAIMMIELALEMAEQYGNRECLLRGYNILKDLYEDRKDTKHLKEVYIKLVELLQRSGKRQELVKATNALALMHLRDSNSEAAKACLEMSQETYGKITTPAV